MSETRLPIVTGRCLINAWQCDIMGHMNTRHIEALFDDAVGWMITSACSADASGEHRIGWADRKHVFEFFSEVLAGDAVEIRSSVARLGTSSVTSQHQLVHSVTGKLLATAEIVSVCFDLQQRRSRPIPPAWAQRLAALQP